MASHPIDLTDTQVRAALAGTLTEIRVPVKHAPEDTSDIVPSLMLNRGDLWDCRRHLQNPRAIRCPLGAIGDAIRGRFRWRAPVTMPLRYSRLAFENTGVRVERAGSTFEWVVSVKRI